MTFWIRILGALGLAGLLLLGLDRYCRTPLEVQLDPIAVGVPLGEPPSLSLVFHGSVDAENPQFPRLIHALEATGRRAQFVNWSTWSDHRLRAAASAEEVGRQLAEQLATAWRPPEESGYRDPDVIVADPRGRLDASLSLRLELIAHSSGAFVLDALCEALRQQMTEPIEVRMVFIDPFQLEGLMDWRHGAHQHGRCADVAIAIINTDDPAPTTNAPLARAWNLDVTDHPDRGDFADNGHYWALEFLIREAPSAVWLQPHWTVEHLPRGEVYRAIGVAERGQTGEAGQVGNLLKSEN